MVISQLELKPGSVVVESGTGSASLSHALIRTVAPSGHLHTFDFHEERLLKAKEEFRIHGIDSWVTPKHRDVLSSGFDLENAADAVFLDIPAPWDAIIHAKRALKKDRVTRICSFSPCMEQVRCWVRLIASGCRDHIPLLSQIVNMSRSNNLPRLVQFKAFKYYATRFKQPVNR